MSQQFSERYQRCQNLEVRLRGAGTNSPAAYRECFILWCYLLYDMKKSMDDRLPQVLADLMVQDYHTLLHIFDELDSCILTRDRATFKQLRLSNIVINQFLSFFKKDIHNWFFEESVSSFRFLHQLFSFFKKLTLDEKELEDDAVMSYVETENRVRSLDPTVGSDISDIAHAVLGPRRFNIESSFCPKHGNGTTADSGRHLLTKYLNMHDVPPRIGYLIRHYDLENCFPREVNFLSETDRERFANKLICVPKSFKKKRTICAEPAVFQYCQQGVMNLLNDFWKTSRFKRRYCPDDQQQNRELAWEGSINGSYSTIDLSAASDSVSWKLIQNSLKGTWLYPWLLCTRSTETLLPDGTLLSVAKFSAMGSSVNFPIEVFVFCCYCELAIRNCGDVPAMSRYVVYGDDIVIETKYVKELTSLLNQNGFVINTDKSFSNLESPFFRESCGAEYLNGECVLPLRISRRFTGLSWDRKHPETFECLMDFANSAYRFPLLRCRLVSALREGPIIDGVQAKTALEFGNGDGNLWSPSPSNFNAEFSFPTDKKDGNYYHCFHRPVLRSVTHISNVVVEEQDGNLDLCDDIRYFETLRSTRYRTQVVEPSNVSLGLIRNRELRVRYIPVVYTPVG